MDLGGGKGDRWCPISYEHLPDFCYVCGIIGHIDRACSRKLGKDEPVPYSKELRFVPARKPFGASLGRSGPSASCRGGRSGRARIQGFRWKLGLTNVMSKDCEGRSGGLAIFWRSDIDLHV
jgi:hypothetical protein